MSRNLDQKTVAGFGDEWSHFKQDELSQSEHERLFQRYFSNFPWHLIDAHTTGFDLGCGSGRWAKLVAQRVGKLHCIDASEKALAVAKNNLSQLSNCEFHHSSVDAIPLTNNSMDFGYSLGVLHHVPDTQAGIQACVDKLKPGAPFLLYLYYALDNKPLWFRWLWRASNLARILISRFPHGLKTATCNLIALTVYLPLAIVARVLQTMKIPTRLIPLASYSDTSFYTMKTDAYDRFGTRLEQRFTQDEMRKMMKNSGLERIQFNENIPYWCAVGYKKS
ncbi:MAG: class I SAM-dependent methyltransferase [Gammaproteobacteria bacterium]|nr:class I SAM-dependent methyltransferase [Gammaproteobacteria bacterium]